MAADDDWTPAKGWAKAAAQSLIRAAIALALAWAGLLLLRGVIGWLEQESHQEISTVAGGLIALFGGGTGLAGGFVLSRGLSDSTGLIGSHLIAPACVPFVLGLFALHHIAVLTPPTWQNVAFYLYGTNAIATCATAVALLLRES